MNSKDQVYVNLQKHLDNQAVGFPATRSGVEIKILKHIFTPQEAEITSYLSYKLEPLKAIFDRVGHLLESPEELEKLLDGIQKKGGIESKIKNGIKHYCCAPFVIGMYEFQLGRLTPEFIKDFNELRLIKWITVSIIKLYNELTIGRIEDDVRGLWGRS